MSETPYDDLSPTALLDAIEALDLHADGSVTPLNSFENRVYQFGIEDAAPVIAKFYRPGRWSDAAIEEEHAFMQELDSAEVPCVAPLRHDGATLFRHLGFRYAVFPREAGRVPNVEDPVVLRVLGHALGRLHAVGASGTYEHRARLSVATFGRQSVDFLIASGFVDFELLAAYEAVANQLVERIEPIMADVRGIRIHGDCHLGNLLMRDDADAPLGARPNFVDFDDTMTGPPIQDLWMLLSGDTTERSSQLRELVSAYEAFHDFDTRATRLIEPLRALRMLYHAAWIGRRWADPAFPVAFPAFGETRYWSEHILALKEQLAALDEPPLAV